MVKAEYFFRDQKIYCSPCLINNPTISVILPTYCRGDNGFLSRAIDSVLSQRFQSFELIVMDDGSLDSTQDIMAEYVKQDDRIIHIRHDENCGLPALRVNEGLMMARGRYCAYQFDDDYWMPDALQILMKALKNNPDYGLAYGVCNFDDKALLGKPFSYYELINGNYIANNSVLHHRALFEKYGGYDMHIIMRRLSDWDLWLRWSKYNRFMFVDKLVSFASYRMPHSLGNIVPLDMLSSRMCMEKYRDVLLAPTHLKDYVVDDMRYFSHLKNDYYDEIVVHQILTFQSRHRKYWPIIETKNHTRKNVVVVFQYVDASLDITITNLNEYLNNALITKIHFSEFNESSIKFADIIILFRCVSSIKHLLQVIKDENKCLIYMMDDDLLNIYELSDKFSDFAPGKPSHQIILENMHQASLVVTYSKASQKSVMPINHRNIVLETNIASRWLKNARQKCAMAYEQKNEATIIKMGFTGGSEARKEEFAFLWPVIVQLSHKMKEKIEIHFWGFKPENTFELVSPYFHKEFMFNYDEYLRGLVEQKMDIMIAPLFDEKIAKKAKCPIKFLEITAAGAIGVYSDVEPYSIIEHEVTGFKCINTQETWLNMLIKVLQMSFEQKNQILSNALNLVEKNFIAEIQAPRLSVTFEAALCHAKMKKYKSNKPKIAYFFHSAYLREAENHLFSHLTIAHEYAFEPIIILPLEFKHRRDDIHLLAAHLNIKVYYLPICIDMTDGTLSLYMSSVEKISAWLIENDISLVHSVTFMRGLGEACHMTSIPHVVSLYAVDNANVGSNHCDIIHSDSFYYASKWSREFGVPARRILSSVPDEYFEVMQKHSQKQHTKIINFGMFGTMQPSHSQLQVIEAIGLLLNKHNITVKLRIYGYDCFYSEYMNDCKKMVTQYGLEEHVSFEGFIRNAINVINDIDILVCANDHASVPQAVLEAMAARKLVVTTLVGGIDEVISNNHGIILKNNTPDEIAKGLLKAFHMNKEDLHGCLERAFKLVKEEASRNVVASLLFRLYVDAIENKIKKKNMHELMIIKNIKSNNEEMINNKIPEGVVEYLKSIKEAIFKWRFYFIKYNVNNKFHQNFSELKNFTFTHFKCAKFEVMESEDLRGMSYREYIIPFKMAQLSMIQTVFLALIPSSKGMIGVEIVSFDQQILAHVLLPTTMIHSYSPTTFQLPVTLKNLQANWQLRIFVKDVERSISTYELVKHSKRGMQVKKLPFLLLA